jgi:hypothetical protein
VHVMEQLRNTFLTCNSRVSLLARRLQINAGTFGPLQHGQLVVLACSIPLPRR